MNQVKTLFRKIISEFSLQTVQKVFCLYYKSQRKVSHETFRWTIDLFDSNKPLEFAAAPYQRNLIEKFHRGCVLRRGGGAFLILFDSNKENEFSMGITSSWSTL